jgi:hypothetical protein
MTVVIVFVILAIFYVVVAYFASKTWQVLHVLLLVGIFFSTIGFMYVAACTLRTHETWGAEYNKIKGSFEKESLKNDLLEHGFARDESGVLQTAPDSIRSLRAELERALIARGRVWRGCSPGTYASGTVTVTTAPPGVGVAAPPPNGIDAKTVLYAFKESPTTTEGYRLPAEYVGEFQATAVSPTTVTLAPSLVPNDAAAAQRMAQRVAAATQGGTWTLYEVMPLDSHQLFAGMDRAALESVFSRARMGLSDAEYSPLIDEYANDGKPAPADAPADRSWPRIRLLKNHKFDVDAAGAPRFAEQYFDPSGRAVPALLRAEGTDPRAEQLDLAKGAELVLPPETAQPLIDQGIAESVEVVYVRELRDYTYLFQSLYRRGETTQDAILVNLRDIAAWKAADAQAVAAIGRRTTERDNLTEDRSHVFYEREQVTAYLGRLDQKFTAVRGQLSHLFNATNSQAAELATIQATLAAQIEERARQTAGTNPAPAGP